MRDLRSVAAWCWHEASTAGQSLREAQLWAALACGLLLWTLAYQIPYSYQLDIGGNPQTLRQHDDDPFLRDFNAPEPPKLYLYTNHDKIPFRWAKDRSTISIPGLGGERWHVALNAVSGRPDKSAVISRWSDGATSIPVTVSAVPAIYHFQVAADRAGDLTLQFATPPLETPGDPRTLGMVMFRLNLDQGRGPHLPAPRQLALLALALALAYELLRRLALAPRAALAGALGLAVVAALLLASERPALTLITPRLPLILSGCYALAILLDALCRHVFAQGLRQLPRWKAPGLADSAIVGLIVLAFALRLGGMVHPHARFSDDGLNAHDLAGFTQGEVFFTEGLPSESGGGPAPYPPGQYIVFAPAQLFVPSDTTALKLLLRVANALWDSLSVGLLWYLLRRSGYRPRTALLGAALYVLPPPILTSLSVGEFANVFGQGMALLLLTVLALHARDLQRPSMLPIVLVVLALPLLSHLGITISLACLLICLTLIWMLRREYRRAAWRLILAGIVVGTLIVLFYYLPFADVLLARFGKPPGPAASAPVFTFAQKLAQQKDLAYTLGMHQLLVALGAIGAVQVALRTRDWPFAAGRPALGSLLGAWWGGTLLSLGLLIFASQGVRWQAFFYPALCLGAGPALGQFGARGRAGRLLALALLGFLLWYGLHFWIAQVRDYSP